MLGEDPTSFYEAIKDCWLFIRKVGKKRDVPMDKSLPWFPSSPHLYAQAGLAVLVKTLGTSN